MQLTEDLTEDRIERLIIKEVPEGTRFTITVKPSGLIVERGGGPHVTLSHDGPEDLELPDEKIRKLVRHPQLSVAKLMCIYSEHTAFDQSQIYLDSFDSEMIDGAKATLPMDQLDHIAIALGFLPVHYMVMPQSLRVAMLEENQELVDSLCKRVSQMPSLFGLADSEPEYYAVLRPFESMEEKDMKWRI